MRDSAPVAEETKTPVKAKPKANSYYKELADEFVKRIASSISIDELKKITDEVISANIPDDFKQSIYQLIDTRDIEFRNSGTGNA